MPENLLIVVTTVGEEATFHTINSIRRHTPKPYTLAVWYDACGRGVDENFLHLLRDKVSDIIVSEKNQDIAAILGYYALYRDFDYMIWAMADTPAKPGYFERIFEAFEECPRAGVVGEAWRQMPEKYVVSDFDRGVDGLVAIKKEAIEACGGFSPSFNGKGPFHQELYRRMSRNGWDFVAVDGLCEAGCLKHEGRDKDPKWRDKLDRDNRAWLAIDKADYSYPWWTRKMGKTEAVHA